MLTDIYFPYADKSLDTSHINVWEKPNESFPLELTTQLSDSRLTFKKVVCTILNHALHVTVPSETDEGIAVQSIQYSLLHRLNIVVNNPIVIPRQVENPLY